MVIVLWVNLSITFNKLKSTVRIAAYIAVALEETTENKWIGWEKSLELYRDLANKYDEKYHYISLMDLLTNEKTFYSGIFIIHFLMSVFLVVIPIIPIYQNYLNNNHLCITQIFYLCKIQIFCYILVFLVWLIIMDKCWKSFRPVDITELIKTESEKWMEILPRKKDPDLRWR